ncbi:MAG: hypothetical protein L0H83_07545, partial [Salinisphaera sp.]|nr:hypothetical protein [Salinisphaera sp.]
MNLRPPSLALGLLSAVLLAGCAHQRPVVYPGASGPAATQAAIDACMASADAYGLDAEGGDVAGRSV